MSDYFDQSELFSDYESTGEKLDLKQLKFSLFNQRLHPDLFLSVKRIETFSNDVVVKICCMEDGHVLELTRSDHSITQTLLPEFALLPSMGCKSSRRVMGCHQFEISMTDEICYFASLQSDKVDEEVYEVLEKEFASDSEQSLLVHTHLGESLIDKTNVLTEAFDDAFLVNIIHLIPSKFTVIRAQSLLEWKNG